VKLFRREGEKAARTARARAAAILAEGPATPGIRTFSQKGGMAVDPAFLAIFGWLAEEIKH
jgi:hypothetical protein